MPSAFIKWFAPRPKRSKSKKKGSKVESKRESIKVGTKLHKEAAEEKFQTERNALLSDTKAFRDLKKLQNQFHDMIHKAGGGAYGSVSKGQLKTSFRETGINVDDHIFEKIYNLMDVDQDGSIDENEFIVTMCYFLHHGESAKDKIELAYTLFDTNRDGTISKREFSDMVSTVIGNRLDTILGIDKCKELFVMFLKKEVSEELLIFYEEMLQVNEKYGKDGIPTDVAQALFANYIEVDSEQQVNISESERETIRDKVSALVADSKPVPTSTFEGAIYEVKGMLEQGALMRFRQKIKAPPHDLIAGPAWVELGLTDDDTLSLENFKKWTALTPGIFDFLDAVSEEVNNAINQA